MKVNRFGMSQKIFATAMMDLLQSRYAVTLRTLQSGDREVALTELHQVKEIFKKTFLELDKEQKSFLLMLEETIREIEALTMPIS